MHVPFIHSQTVNRPAPAPSMSIEDIAAGIEAAIRAIGEHESDIKAAEGATHSILFYKNQTGCLTNDSRIVDETIKREFTFNEGSG